MGFRQLFSVDEPVDYSAKGAFFLYTDGSCIGNGLPNAGCGWAFVCAIAGQDGIQRSGQGGRIGGTNNQMEMTAAIEGLSCISKISTVQPVTLYSDSKYVIETLKGAYGINKNHELWQRLFEEVHKFKHIQFEWVKGHASNIYNIQVDKMANSEAWKYESMK